MNARVVGLPMSSIELVLERVEQLGITTSGAVPNVEAYRRAVREAARRRDLRIRTYAGSDHRVTVMRRDYRSFTPSPTAAQERTREMLAAFQAAARSKPN